MRDTRRAFDEDAGPVLPLKLNRVCAIAPSYLRQSQELTGSVNISEFPGTNPTDIREYSRLSRARRDAL